MSDEEPSRVLHLRNVTSEVSHADLQNLASPFGKVQNIVLLRDKNQALIQMDSVAAASAVLNFYTTGYTEVGGRRVYLKYSRHQELTGKAAAQGNGCILLVSMSNPMYDIRTTLQITADLLYQVFAPYGVVTKIVVIQKSTGENRQQALVQFDKHETAEQAKQYLQGQNVYVGTSVYFTLDIQYSNLEDLTVRTSSPTARVFATGGAVSQVQQFPAQAPMQQIPAAAQQQPVQQQQQAQQHLLQQQLLQQQLLQQQMMLQQQGVQQQQPHQQLSQLQQQVIPQLTQQQLLQQQMAQQQQQQQLQQAQAPIQPQQYGMPSQQMYASQMYQQGFQPQN
uniref:Polypyrimidine tract-binding protein 1/2 n=1 Tax=Euglena gracilis TaxID=3039 RepID=A0AA51YEB0_EUGGR|nr:polypyrimidine tract-binding protein 1/2 [Euglena gracilis]BDX17181.1 polypyrimidine tract-binding protein F [Euglena gracilis]